MQGKLEADRRCVGTTQVSKELMSKAAPGAVFLHCLPRHQEEVTDEVRTEAPLLLHGREQRLRVVQRCYTGWSGVCDGRVMPALGHASTDVLCERPQVFQFEAMWPRLWSWVDDEGEVVVAGAGVLLEAVAGLPRGREPHVDRHGRHAQHAREVGGPGAKRHG